MKIVDIAVDVSGDEVIHGKENGRILLDKLRSREIGLEKESETRVGNLSRLGKLRKR